MGGKRVYTELLMVSIQPRLAVGRNAERKCGKIHGSNLRAVIFYNKEM